MLALAKFHTTRIAGIYISSTKLPPLFKQFSRICCYRYQYNPSPVFKFVDLILCQYVYSNHKLYGLRLNAQTLTIALSNTIYLHFF